jgi:hypothetical protein
MPRDLPVKETRCVSDAEMLIELGFAIPLEQHAIVI